MHGSNLPPGVSVGDIPGNRAEDEAWERLYEDMSDSGLTADKAARRWRSQPALRLVCQTLCTLIDESDRWSDIASTSPLGEIVNDARTALAKAKLSDA